MYRKILVGVALFGVVSLVQAATPDMQPGQWEYTNTVRFEGPINIPEQTMTNTQCVSRDDLDEAETYSPSSQDCQVEERDVGADRVSFTLFCPSDQGGEARMTMDMRMMGDRVEGESVTSVSMGEHSMTVRTRIEGRRVGDC